MKLPFSILMLSVSLLFAPACDGNDDDDKKSESNDDDDDDKDDDDKDDKDDDDKDDDEGGSQVPLWDCYCEVECDGDFIDYEEEVCSDAESLDLAIEISTEACAAALSDDCFDVSCACDCDEDPDLACG